MFKMLKSLFNFVLLWEQKGKTLIMYQTDINFFFKLIPPHTTLAAVIEPHQS